MRLQRKQCVSGFFDSLPKKQDLSVRADDIFGLWGNLLVSYGSAYKKISSQATGFLDKRWYFFRCRYMAQRKIENADRGQGFNQLI